VALRFPADLRPDGLSPGGGQPPPARWTTWTRRPELA